MTTAILLDLERAINQERAKSATSPTELRLSQGTLDQIIEGLRPDLILIPGPGRRIDALAGIPFIVDERVPAGCIIPIYPGQRYVPGPGWEWDEPFHTFIPDGLYSGVKPTSAVRHFFRRVFRRHA